MTQQRVVSGMSCPGSYFTIFRSPEFHFFFLFLSVVGGGLTMLSPETMRDFSTISLVAKEAEVVKTTQAAL